MPYDLNHDIWCSVGHFVYILLGYIEWEFNVVLTMVGYMHLRRSSSPRILLITLDSIVNTIL